MTVLNTPGLARNAIRKAVQAALKGRTSAGDSVFVSQVGSSDAGDLPKILISTVNESVEVFDLSPKRYKRSVDILVECLVDGDDEDDMSQRAETLSDQVEQVLEKNEQLGLGDLINSLNLVSVSHQGTNEGESPIMNVALRYVAEVFLYSIGERVFPDFKEVRTKFKMSSDATLNPEDQANLGS